MKKTVDSLKQSKWFPLVIGILSIVLGVVGILRPNIRMENIALLAGIIFLLYGLLQVVNGIRIKNNAILRVFTVILGLIIIVLAILDFINLKLIGKYLPTLVGFFMIICAVTNLIPSFAMMKNGLKGWWYGALPAIILLVLGVFFLLKPGFVGQAFGIYSGIALLIHGASSLISFGQMNS